ncbi:type 1 fimbria pilin [Stenotrophomonas maltophilia]|uniref:fimbrial protein n=1 Tax=Stenotrophomonas chelatiphaga TaxID=517011 RepID=UPI000FA488D2|nr:fimbrial protein [Stenotrophomonas chelatiphaga]MCS4230545.1 type 1 fimbria pilin [Stenotrophomonas chelatiphaga]ROQ45527.1 type 1 fimbria pilin [Stenotrophomonas maltophilia]
MKQIRFYRLLTALALCNAGSALAQSCEHPPEWPTAFQIILPLQGTITVGADVPDGTEIYTSRHSSASGAFVRCSGGPGTVSRTDDYIGSPGRPSAFDRVYETSIPGVGIAMWYAGTKFPYNAGNINVGTGTLTYNFNKSLDFSLYKIGPISAGVLQGSSLPRARQYTGGAGSINLWEAQVVGQLSIVTGTCRVGDVRVPMGDIPQSTFTGIGSHTAWQRYEVPLTGCPAFFGRRAAYARSDSGTVERADLRVANRIGVRLDPSTAILDEARSIIALQPGAPGAPAARGIGIQVAWDDESPVAFRAFRDSGLPLTATANGSYRIPLRARYYQVEDLVRGGPANAAMVMTLRYE